MKSKWKMRKSILTKNPKLLHNVVLSSRGIVTSSKRDSHGKYSVFWFITLKYFFTYFKMDKWEHSHFLIGNWGTKA